MKLKVRLGFLATLLAGATVLASCSGPGSSAEETTHIKVFAAASLQESFDKISKDFHRAHPEYEVSSISYDGSQALATQAKDGADVDVLAFASEETMEPLADQGLVEKPQIFAQNRLQLAVQKGNPKNITSLDDLKRRNASLVICAPEVPCGQATEKLAKQQNVKLEPVSQETNVTSVVNRVSQGEADAGLVYTTDVTAAGDSLEGVDVPGTEQSINRYPLARMKNTKNSEEAQAFIDYVMAKEGQKALREAGFGKTP